MWPISFRTKPRRCLGVAAWVVALLLAAGTVLPCMAQQRVALVVGNSGYRSVGRLANPGNDATLVARTLKASGFTLVGGDAQLDLDKPRFDAAVEQFGRAIARAEVALFYYSGHGLQVNGTNYLVPVDANPTRTQDLDFQMVSADLVLRQMSGSSTKLNIIILDACRNNPFGGRGLRSAGGGLAEMRAPEGTLISYATQPGAVASDGNERDSPFTLALVDAMRQPGLDIFRLFNRVGLEVKKSTDGQQQPWLAASPIEGEFAFAPAGTPAPVPPQPAPTPAQSAALVPPVVAPPARQGPATVPESPAGAGFRCPAPGTTIAAEDEVFDWKGDAVTVTRPTGTWTLRAQGTDPGNPDLCVYYGHDGTVHRLAGWFDTDLFTFPDDPTRPMLALLQGQANELMVRSSLRHPPPNRVITVWETTWRPHGHESLAIGGRGYDTLVFDVTQGSNLNSFTGSGRVWYAPALRLFVRWMWKSSRADDVLGFTVTGVSAPGAAQ